MLLTGTMCTFKILSPRARRLEVKGARKNGASVRDSRGERERLPERPMKIVFTRFLRVQKIPVG